MDMPKVNLLRLPRITADWLHKQFRSSQFHGSTANNKEYLLNFIIYSSSTQMYFHETNLIPSNAVAVKNFENQLFQIRDGTCHKTSSIELSHHEHVFEHWL